MDLFIYFIAMIFLNLVNIFFNSEKILELVNMAEQSEIGVTVARWLISINHRTSQFETSFSTNN